jgi:hypothetical protein
MEPMNYSHNPTNETSSSVFWYSYLALIPRGLQHVVSDIVRQQLNNKYEFRIELLSTPEMEASKIIPRVTQKIVDHQEKQIQRKKNSKKSGDRVALPDDENRTSRIQDYFAQTVGSVVVDTSQIAPPLPNSRNEDECDNKQPTALKPKQQMHINLGYNAQQQLIWNCAGQLTGSVWYQLDTTAPAHVVGTQLRCFGPLLALIACTGSSKTSTNSSPDNVNDTTGTTRPITANLRLGPLDTLSEAKKDLEDWIGRSNYGTAFERALQVWYDHTQVCWPSYRPDNNNNKDENPFKLTNLSNRYETGKLSFRLSCVRDSSSLTTKQTYLYTRQELLETALAWGMVPAHPYQETWTVNLTQYDVEVVLLMQDTLVAVGLALRPYQMVGGRCFSNGAIPPDISAPYVGGDALKGVVRLRPTTAHMLLHLAQVQTGEIVLDPCAGIGTIPLEVETPYECGSSTSSSVPSETGIMTGTTTESTTPCYGPAISLGGDLVLNNASIAAVAQAMVACTRPIPPFKRPMPFPSFLAAWDAAHLPLRTGSVDVIVSDLPFGKQCLSVNALAVLLPLMVSEMARVLAPSSSSSSSSSMSSSPSRIVILCGSYELLLQSLEATPDYWCVPCRAIFPVSIGGLLAWIVQVERTATPFSTGVHNHLGRVRKMTAKRDRMAHQRRKAEEHQMKQQEQANAGNTKTTTVATTKGNAKKSRIQAF